MGLAAAVGIGVVVGLITLVDGRLRIADETPLTLLVCVSGAIAGWAVVETFGVGKEGGVSAASIIIPLLGALAIAIEAWRGRRRTFSELGLHTHSE